MKIGIMQPYLFPYIGYWQLLNAVDKYVIYDDVNYIKGGWINRNNILINGEAKLISLQMQKASPNKLINNIEISGNIILNKKLLKTIESCYKKAPFFKEVFPIIESIINQEEKNLARYIEFSIRKISEYLSIDTEFIVSSDIVKNNDLRGQDKVIEICKKIGANEYFNAIGGENLYSRDDFASQNIKLNFLKTKTVEYQQFGNKFVPNLSIIDIMMFNKTSKINDILNNYEVL